MLVFSNSQGASLGTIEDFKMQPQTVYTRLLTVTQMSNPNVR